jgi:hypothetical protein
MNDLPARRLAAMSGLALAAAVALWWLGSTRLALDHGSDAGRPSAQALQALWVVRAMALALLGLRVAALRGWRAGMETALGLAAPAWPLVVLAWSASSVPLMQVALMELALLAAGLALPLLGQGIGRVLRQSELAVVAATAIGAAAAAAVWFTRGTWPLTLP